MIPSGWGGSSNGSWRPVGPTPVTAKIRLGCSRNHINANQIAQVVEQAGAAALTVHGRTAQDFFRGTADWDRISEIKSSLRRIPLIGNGDLDSAEKAVAAFRRYRVDGIMVARACLGRPWLFRQIHAALRGQPVPRDPTFDEQRQCLLHHYELVVRRFGEAKGTLLMRKYGCCYAQGIPGARQFRKRIGQVGTRDDFLRAVDECFPRDVPDTATRSHRSSHRGDPSTTVRALVARELARLYTRAQ